jgi:hypothetical protein
MNPDAPKRRRFSLAAIMVALSALTLPLSLMRAGVVYEEVGFVVVAMLLIVAWLGGFVGFLTAGYNGIMRGIFWIFVLLLVAMFFGALVLPISSF